MRGFPKSTRSRVRALSPAVAIGFTAMFTAFTPVANAGILPVAPMAQVAPGATAKITGLEPGEVFTIGDDLVFVFGDNLDKVTGITVDGITTEFFDEGDGSLSFYTPARPVGTYQVRLVTAEGVSADNGTVDDLKYVVPPPVPKIFSITPNSGPVAGGNTVTIKGDDLTGSLGVVFGDFSLADDLVNKTDEEITVTVPAALAAGKVDVLVITNGGSSTNTAGDDYYYGVPAPTPTPTPIVTPTPTPIPTSTPTPTPTPIVTPTPTPIVTPTPTPSPTPVPIPVPVVSSITPTSGPTTGSTVVTINGTGLANTSGVSFGGTAGTSIQQVSATQIRVTSPAKGAGVADVIVTTPGGSSANTAADNFTFVVPPPTVTSISPATGVVGGGTVVTINGTNLAGTTGVSFGGTAGTSIQQVSGTQIRVTSPAKSAGKADVIVTTAGGPSANVAADDFTYFVPAPIVSSISPTTGLVTGNTVVTVNGQNLAGASAKVGGNTAAVTPVSDTQIKITTPAGTVGKADVIVTTAGGASANSAADDFTYLPLPPTITGIAPASGPTLGGTSVTITGTNLTGATAVKFGSASATGVTVDSATQIRVTSPAGAVGTADVSVTTAGGTSANVAADNFTYTVPAPVLTRLSVTTGLPAGGTVVTITGTNLAGTTGVKFGDVAATNVVQVSDTSVRATSPAGAAGTVDVTVTTAGGTSATGASSKFTYSTVSPLVPKVGRIFPNIGLAYLGGVVTIQGTNFKGVRGVKVGSRSARFYVAGNTIIAIMPALPKGTYPVTITTVFGTSTANSAARYTYIGF